MSDRNPVSLGSAQWEIFRQYLLMSGTRLEFFFSRCVIWISVTASLVKSSRRQNQCSAWLMQPSSKFLSKVSLPFKNRPNFCFSLISLFQQDHSKFFGLVFFFFQIADYLLTTWLRVKQTCLYQAAQESFFHLHWKSLSFLITLVHGCVWQRSPKFLSI